MEEEERAVLVVFLSTALLLKTVCIFETSYTQDRFQVSVERFL
jgi:hypothetical protein